MKNVTNHLITFEYIGENSAVTTLKVCQISIYPTVVEVIINDYFENKVTNTNTVKWANEGEVWILLSSKIHEDTSYQAIVLNDQYQKSLTLAMLGQFSNIIKLLFREDINIVVKSITIKE